MKVLRHEENDKACPITCNGEYNTRWSKTMVGYDSEETAYALELTFNYGVPSYQRGEGLQRFIIQVEDAGKQAAAADRLGFKVTWEGSGAVVRGPDAYDYELRSQSGMRKEPFEEIVLTAANPKALSDWYVDMLHMTLISSSDEGMTVGFRSLTDQQAVHFLIKKADQNPVKVTQWEGRNAIALPEAQVRALNKRILKESPQLILHEMRELEEKLGTLVILILRDPGGFELCVVSSETFDPSVAAATNYEGPDWTQREAFLSAMSDSTKAEL